MKRIIFSVISIVLINTCWATTNPLATTQETSKGDFALFLKAIGDFQTLKQEIAEKKISLDFEQNLTFPSLSKITAINDEINKNLEIMDSLSPEKHQEEIELINHKIEELEQARGELEETYQLRLEKQQGNIREYILELDEADENIEKQRRIIRSHGVNLGTQIGVFVLVVIFLLFAKYISKIIINRSTSSIQENRKEALCRLSNIIFNSLLTLIVLGVLFSQFMSFLPFLAIMGTGVAFAVRDILSSFIAWFVLTYRVGDVIRIESAEGKVEKITPFLTHYKAVKGGVIMDEVSTVPNKVIFEGEVTNLSESHWHNMPVEMKFLLTEDSSFVRARELLETTIANVIIEELAYQSEIEIKAKELEKHIEAMKIKTWLHMEQHGINLFAHFYIRTNHSFENIQSKIIQKFVEAVHKKGDISLKFLDSKSKAAKKTKKKAEDHVHPH